MRLPERNDITSRQSAGEEFVKKIGLLGAILFIILSILGTLLMAFANRAELSEPAAETEKLPPSAYASPKRIHSTIEIASDAPSLLTFPHQPF